MFKSKKKDKKEKSTSNSASSSYNETSKVQTLQNGTIITRQISTTSQISNTAETFHSTVHHSNSAGSLPQILSSLQTDASPWTVGGGGLSRNPPLLPPTSLSSTFGTRSNSTGPFGSGISTQPRLSIPYSSSRLPGTRSNLSPLSPRTAFGGNPTGSYPSRTRQSPFISVQDTTPNTNIIRSTPVYNEDSVPTYPNNSLKRGKALIINNIKFMDIHSERLGAEKDSKDLEKLLKKIGFEVEVKKDMKGQQMAKKVEQFSKTNFNNYDASMVVIMSHGNNAVNDGRKVARVTGGYTEIAGIDNVTVLVDDILEKFTATKGHPSLRGKPKIFIFQCCRGEKDEEPCHDAVPTKKVISDHSDMLIAWSTLPGYLSNRDPKTGTWFIQSICEVFERQYQDQHIEDMLRTVNIRLSTKHPNYTQTAPFENRGFKRCYLHKRNAQ